MNLIFCFVTILSTRDSCDLFLLLSGSLYFAVRISFLPTVTGTQMDHNIGFSSAFPRNQSRLCDLCSWRANHHVVFCQIPDSSCLFAWWYSNAPFLVCITTASFMHQQGEGIYQRGLLWNISLPAKWWWRKWQHKRSEQVQKWGWSADLRR